MSINLNVHIEIFSWFKLSIFPVTLFVECGMRNFVSYRNCKSTILGAYCKTLYSTVVWYVVWCDGMVWKLLYHGMKILYKGMVSW